MNNPRKVTHLPVTNSGPRPGDFPIGSVQSRAAARAMMERKQDEVPRTFIVYGNDSVPEARCQDIVVRIGGVQFNDSDSSPEPSARDRCQDETIPEVRLQPTDATPQEPTQEPEPSEKPTEERVPEPEVRRRPLVRPSLQRRRAWWRHGLS